MTLAAPTATVARMNWLWPFLLAAAFAAATVTRPVHAESPGHYAAHAPAAVTVPMYG